MKNNLSKEEQQYLNSIENDEWQSVNDLEQQKQEAKKLADNTFPNSTTK